MLWKAVLIVLFVVTIPVWIVLCLLFPLSGGPNAFAVAMFGLLTFLCAMLGFWASLGNVWWRWIVIASCSPMMGFISGLKGSESSTEFHVYCMSIIAIVAITTLILRVWKGRLQVVADQEGRIDALQFGIKHIFIWTTAIAIFLGVGQFFLKYVDLLGLSRYQASTFLMIFGLSLSISIATVVNIWAMLGSRISIFKTITLILVTSGAMVANFFLFPIGYFFAIVTLVTQFLILFTMFVLRRQGFRFVKAG